MTSFNLCSSVQCSGSCYKISSLSNKSNEEIEFVVSRSLDRGAEPAIMFDLELMIYLLEMSTN